MSGALSVRILLCKYLLLRAMTAANLFFFVYCVLPPISGFADDKVIPQQQTPAHKITITADQLVSESEAKVAEFIGNVKVIRKGSVITADRLKIYYAKALNDQNTATDGKAAIEKIIATGNVRIVSDDLIAVAQKAVYIRKTQIVTLSGTNTLVTSGGSSLSGAEIKLHMDNESIRVSSGAEGRVRAILNPTKKK